MIAIALLLMVLSVRAGAPDELPEISPVALFSNERTDRVFISFPVLRSHDRFALPDLADGGAMRTDADFYSKKTFVALFTGS